MRILLIEDDPLIGTAIEQALNDAHYSVDWVKDGQQGLSAALAQDYSAILLDLGLPKKDGLDILKTLRDQQNLSPVIITTARDAVEDRIKGLDLGADDYLVKPFKVSELQARIRAVTRRNQGAGRSVLECGDLMLDKATAECFLSGKKISLSAREFTLMRILMLRPGRVFSKEELEEQVYGWNEEIASNAIEFIIHGLRKKLGKSAIKNIRGLGWMISQ